MSGVAGGGTPHAIAGGANSPGIITIGGLGGSPDAAPSAPNAANDEFEQNGAGLPAGWSSTAALWGALPTLNTNDAHSHLHLVCGAGGLFQGVYKPGPAAPYTVTCKIADAQIGLNGANAAGLWVSQVAPGSAGTLLGVQIQGRSVATVPPQLQTINANAATGVIGAGAAAANVPVVPVYFRWIVTANSVTPEFSFGGLVWEQLTPTGALVVTNTWVGLFVDTNGGGQPGEAFFDWVRFTQP